MEPEGIKKAWSKKGRIRRNTKPKAIRAEFSNSTRKARLGAFFMLPTRMRRAIKTPTKVAIFQGVSSIKVLYDYP
jgi:hypothetical protein